MIKLADIYFDGKVPVCTKLKFVEEKQVYTVRASNVRFLICTKPFNLRKTVLYTIVDLAEHIRGPENLIFCFGAETDAQCINMLNRLTNGDSKISHRNRIKANIEKVHLPYRVNGGKDGRS